MKKVDEIVSVFGHTVKKLKAKSEEEVALALYAFQRKVNNKNLEARRRRRQKAISLLLGNRKITDKEILNPTKIKLGGKRTYTIVGGS